MPYWSNDLKRFNFQQRTCSTFIPQETNPTRCVCNRYLTAHDNVQTDEKTWNLQMHTKTKTTKCFGTLVQSNSPYLRCDIETDLDALCLLLFGVWNIPVPGLIMRMISDVSSTLDVQLEKEFLKGILAAAVASDAWIITSGYKAEDVSQLIGEIVYKSRIRNPEINFTAIAIGKWGNIQDCRTLENSNKESSSGNNEISRRHKLELNQTHYIFFDDGTLNTMDTGEFASQLTLKISRGAHRRS
ncbi:unnamed protein product [Rotaria sp. Silwood2]|nr:unnamed protein product [Rotaria sp. Silwood2]CAF4309722.1 unnamed protein product [Rotaria sp. Silwood2]